MLKLSNIWIVFALLLTSTSWCELNSSSSLVLDSNTKVDQRYYLYSVLEILPDPENKWKIDDILKQEHNFRPNDTAQTGLSSHIYWLRLTIKNRSMQTKKLIYYLYPNHEIEQYSFSSSGEKLYQRTGILVPIPGRSQVLNHDEFSVLPLVIESKSTQTFYFRLACDSKFLMRFTNQKIYGEAFDNDSFSKAFFYKTYWRGIVCGICLQIALYHLIFFVVVGGRIYLFFSVYIFSFVLGDLSFFGFATRILWPNTPEWNFYFLWIVSGVWTVFFIHFSVESLDIKKYAPRCYQITKFLKSITWLSIVVFCVFPGWMSGPLVLFFTMNFAWLFAIAGYLFWKKFSHVRLYFYANILFVLSLSSASFYITMGFSRSLYYVAIADLGVILQMSLFSISIAQKINQIRKEKEVAQLEALQAARKNETLIYEQNLVLEQRVAHRTIELNKAKENAEASSRAKGSFLTNVSHELRTPLNAILGFTQLLHQSQNLPKKEREHLQIVQQSGQHLLKLINEVLHLSKIEAGYLSIEETSFDLHILLEDLKKMFHIKMENKNLQFVTEFSQIPQYIYTDEAKLRQILINLLSNAVKFTSCGEVRLQVKEKHTMSSQSRMTSLITFEVVDTGPGISSREIKKLFDAFVQTETGRLTKEGTGLGLNISQKFAHLLGSEIKVDSSIGQGTTFTFDLQVGISKEVDVKNSDPKNVIGLSPGQTSYRILVVDDNANNRQLLVEILQPLGFEIKEAADGKEAVSLCEQWQPHLIWMDIKMPIMDGYEATRCIRNIPMGKKTIIIALTASSFEEDRTKILAAGCDAFIRKPYNEQEIFKCLQQQLGVEYILHDTAVETSINLKAESLRFESMAQLPKEWLLKFESALTEANVRSMRNLITKIQDQHQDTARVLEKLLTNFQYDEITQWIDNNK
ncbi:response regulator [Candidatus Uabimicrobium sp. HlEnr_7]|uniref:hybrid sensor histidine kinase/response regulator n=1 Tax=Candidatus Uabimicrobium helgolandensis TaxID=3095367 RepID=UPI0035568B9E